MDPRPPEKPKSSLDLLQDFKASFDFALFAFNYDQEKSLKGEQFGREIVKAHNPSTKQSEIQIYFYSESQETSFTKTIQVSALP